MAGGKILAGPERLSAHQTVAILTFPICTMETGARFFFTYGTLRDDDDSGAPWTKQWIADCVACNGTLHNAMMYQDPDVPYPYVVLSEGDGAVKGRLVTFSDDDLFMKRLREADVIEGCVEGTPESECWYHRVVLPVTKDDGTAVQAYVYVHKAKRPHAKVVPHCDWIKRNCKCVNKAA